MDEAPHEVSKVSPDVPEEFVKAAFKAQVCDLECYPRFQRTWTQFWKLEASREALVDLE